MTQKTTPQVQSLALNKKAFHDFEILNRYEAGIKLNGEEVKSIRLGQVNLKGSFIDTLSGEAFINEMHISRYKFSCNKSYNPTRKRKLILHKKEILKITQAVNQKSITAIPLELYLKKGLIKAAVGICRGKKLYDKRETLKRRDLEMEIKREIKRYR